MAFGGPESPSPVDPKALPWLPAGAKLVHEGFWILDLDAAMHHQLSVYLDRFPEKIIEELITDILVPLLRPRYHL